MSWGRRKRGDSRIRGSKMDKKEGTEMGNGKDGEVVMGILGRWGKRVKGMVNR